MPVVACPKCKKKFKLATEQLGKAVRCSSCQAKFRTAKPASGGAAPSAKPKDKAKTKAKRAPAPPAKKTPRTLEDELFSSAPLKAGAPDPLGNFVLEDPGFGALELGDPENEDSDSDDDMFADRQHLMENPALKGRNPYQSPTGSGGKGKSAGARKMRERLLKHEEAVKSLGFLNMFGGGLTLLLLLPLCAILLFTTPEEPEQAALARFMLMILIPFVLFTAFSVFVGWSVFKLRTWSKIAATILLVPNLLSFPIGTAVGGYFLWVLHCEKGKEVFSNDYQRAIKATPDLRPGKRLIIIVTVVTVLLFLLAVGMSVYFAFSAQS